MSYSTRANKFVSHLTKKEYPFDASGKNGRADKARARAEMEADHRKVEEAGAARAGRPLSLRELQSGGPMPKDERSIREKVTAEIQHSPKPEQQHPFNWRLAQLEKQWQGATLPKEKARIERLYTQVKAAADAYDEKQAEKQAWEDYLASAPVQKAIAHARSYLERVLMDETAGEAAIAEARNRLKLLESGEFSVEDYQSAFEQAEKQATEKLVGREAEYQARLAELRRELGMDSETGIGEGTNGLIEGPGIVMTTDE